MFRRKQKKYGKWQLGLKVYSPGVGTIDPVGACSWGLQLQAQFALAISLRLH
jgi:hypothetical protein